jgi:hypothetical protein
LNIEYEQTPGSWVPVPTAFLFSSIGETYKIRASGAPDLVAKIPQIVFPYKVYGIYAPDWASVYGEIQAVPDTAGCCPSVPTRWRGYAGGYGWFNVAPPFWASVGSITAAGVNADVLASSNAPDAYACAVSIPPYCCNDTGNAHAPAAYIRNIDYENAFSGGMKTAFYAATIPSTAFSVTAAGVTVRSSSYTGTSISGTLSKAANSYVVVYSFTMTFGTLGGTLCSSDGDTTTYGSESTTSVSMSVLGESCGALTITAANSIRVYPQFWPYFAGIANTMVGFGFRN